MSLAQDLKDVAARAEKHIPPELLKSLQKSIDDLERSGIAQRALKAGDLAPAFTLPNAQGRPTALMDLLQRGALIVSFYRGLWCPYCNVELRAYQRVLSEIRALGATLVAISPQTPDRSAATAAENGIEFEVLSDHRNEVAAHYGLAYDAPQAVRTITEKFGHHLSDYNGSDDWRLPISATYVISPSQRIILANVDPDFRRRLDPNDVLTALQRHTDDRQVA
ncbi:MAG: peroxiredoxin-like family protein [Xanthobacteraceae bacterium]